MKSLLQIFAAFSLILMGALVASATNNPVAGMAAMSAVAAGITYSTDFELFPSVPGLHALALLGLKRRHNKPSIGGNKRIYLVLTEDLSAEFLNFDLALTTGKFSGAIPLVTGKKFVEIEAWYDTTKWDGEMKPGGGFTQGLEFEALGYDADIVRLQALLYETPVNVIVQGNDDNLYYLGQKYIPLMFECVGTSGVKGTDRKKVTFRAKQDGLTVPVFPLDADVTFAITPLAA
ncbi:hypothetical protein [Tellurirhabdus rosea]|uniref:hypothetical protein n=1 Tax=Tellurirhabdus rosea TaxID=2674997 RepID=UPI0022541C73|nr:hypothetical protein [Tellurirhabdus rosea]